MYFNQFVIISGQSFDKTLKTDNSHATSKKKSNKDLTISQSLKSGFQYLNTFDCKMKWQPISCKAYKLHRNVYW